MYTGFYGLTEKPFALAPDPHYLFMGRTQRDALATLIYGIEEGAGFIEVIGEVGAGKTTLCRTLLEHIGSDAEVAYIFNPSPSEVELLSAINRELGLPAGARTRTELIEELNKFLLEKNSQGRRVLLVIDEAQNLDVSVLEQIRLLSNLETEREKLIQILLIGQPELEQNLHRSDLRQLRQRITVRWSLQPLSRAEVAQYLEHRLRVAGARDVRIFSPGAVRTLSRLSRGIPRLINAIADRALLAGYAAELHTIDARTVRRVARELPASEAMPWFAIHSRRIAAAAALVVGGMLAGLGASALISGSGARAELDAARLAALTQANAAPEVSAPVKPEPRSLPEQLMAMTPDASAGRALDTLLDVWGHENEVEGELAPNRFPETVRELSKLLVHSTRTRKAQLMQLDMPAILELAPAEGELRYAALMGLYEDGYAVVAIGDSWFVLPDEGLDKIWTGRTFFVWNNFESLPSMQRGMRGTAVRWVQARLTDLGYMSPGDASGDFDEQTESAIRRFQMAHALRTTGEIGAATLIALYQELDYDTPRLMVRGGGAS